MIGEPPSEVGAVHEIATWPAPGVAMTPDGAVGLPVGTTTEVSADAGPDPATLLATTENV